MLKTHCPSIRANLQQIFMIKILTKWIYFHMGKISHAIYVLIKQSLIDASISRNLSFKVI